jgi:hypothetical protein
MVFNTTFSNISVSFIGGTGEPGGNHRPAASNWETLSHNVVSSTPPHERRKLSNTPESVRKEAKL